MQERIRDAIDGKLKQDPRGPWAKELKQVEGLYRLRVGKYRIVCGVRENPEIDVMILAVGHRQNIYEEL